MFEDFQYAYLIGILLLLAPVWAAFYYFRKDLRQEIMTMSLFSAPLGLTEALYVRDYWNPEILQHFGLGADFESILCSFFFGGIASVIYEGIFRKRHSHRHLKEHPKWMLGVCLASALFLYVGIFLLNINSMYVSVALMLLMGSLAILIRRDLFSEAVYSGFLFSALMFVLYLPFGFLFPGIFHDWWLLENLSGVLIAGVPLEEMLFGFGWGFVAGPAYEFVRGITFRKA